jgi:hypothetical protein
MTQLRGGELRLIAREKYSTLTITLFHIYRCFSFRICRARFSGMTLRYIPTRIKRVSIMDIKAAVYMVMRYQGPSSMRSVTGMESASVYE